MEKETLEFLERLSEPREPMPQHVVNFLWELEQNQRDPIVASWYAQQQDHEEFEEQVLQWLTEDVDDPKPDPDIPPYDPRLGL